MKEIIKKTKYGNFSILLDDEDYDYIKSNKLCIYIQNPERIHRYVTIQKCNNGKRKFFLLHRFITNCPNDMVVDHINHNTLDNRKCNLRITTKRGNSENILTNKSGITGVRYYNRTNKWVAYIWHNKKNHTIGYYKTAREAQIARDNYKNNLEVPH